MGRQGSLPELGSVVGLEPVETPPVPPSLRRIFFEREHGSLHFIISLRSVLSCYGWVSAISCVVSGRWAFSRLEGLNRSAGSGWYGLLGECVRDATGARFSGLYRVSLEVWAWAMRAWARSRILWGRLPSCSEGFEGLVGCDRGHLRRVVD
jgi:hypothetical protein